MFYSYKFFLCYRTDRCSSVNADEKCLQDTSPKETNGDTTFIWLPYIGSTTSKVNTVIIR